MKKAIVLWNKNVQNQYSMSDIPLEGFVFFKQKDEKSSVKVTVYLKGFEDGTYGFHVHEKSMDEIKDPCSDIHDCCSQLGGHFHVGEKWSPFNPNGTPHGDHTGDLCFNIHFENRVCDFSFDDTKISLYQDQPNNVVGRSIVIHEEEDDKGLVLYDEDTDENILKNINRLISGNAGNRIACGQIMVYPNDKMKE